MQHAIKIKPRYIPPKLPIHPEIQKVVADLSAVKKELQGKLNELNAAILKANSLQPLEGIPGAPGARGEDGATPQIGIDYLTAEHVQTIIRAVTPRKGVEFFDGKDGRDGRDGETPVVDHGLIVEKVLGLIPVPEDGKDAVVDSEEIAKMVLEELKKTLKVEHIPGLKNEIDSYRNQLAGKIYGKDTWARGGGDTVTSGVGISISNNTNGQKVITATAGGTIYTQSLKSQTVDGSNKTYTTLHTINNIINFMINGEYIHSAEYSFTGTTITFVTALDASLSGKEFDIVYN